MSRERYRYLLPVLLIAGLMTACGSDMQASSGNGNTYKDTKSMVLDILKSEDGKKAVQEATIQQSNKLSILSAGDTQQLQLAVKDVLADTQTNKFLQGVLTDPKFAGQFAKALSKDTKNLQKDLMKDPEYQKQLLSAMKSPDFEMMLLDTMKTTPYRTQMKAVIQESLQSPLFRLELMELMKKVLQEESMPKAKSSGGGGQGGQGGKGGGQGGGQGGQEGGGGQGGDQSSGGSDKGGSDGGGSSDGEDKKKEKDES